MTKRLISLFLTLVLLAVIPLSGRYRYNPFTTKLDYYESGADIDFGDLADVTLTGAANGDVLYYNGAAWINLAVGANTNVLTVAGGVPTWAAAGAPAAHAATHLAAGADSVDHDLLLNYLAAQHLTLPSTIAAVLTDHNKAAHDALLIDADTVDGEHAAAIVTNARVKAHFPDTIANILSDHNLGAHTALGLFDASGDVDHDLTTNYVANQHINWTAATANFSTSGTFSNPMDAAAEVMSISQSAVAGPGGSPLINIDDDRTGVTVNTTAEATIVIDADGSYAFYIADGWIDFGTATQLFNRGDWNTFEDVFWNWSDVGDHADITQTSAAGTATVPLINIDDDRTGVTADTVGEATIVMNAAGTYAFYIQTGQAYFGTDTTQIEDVFITWADAADHMVITQNAVAGIENQALVRITDARDGVTTDEPAESSLAIYPDGANTYAFYVATGISTFGGDTTFQADATFLKDFDITWDGATDRAIIAQSAVAGTEDQPLINIDDDRTGVTTNEPGEATIYVDSDVTGYAFYVIDGYTGFADSVYFSGTIFNFSAGQSTHNDDVELNLGTSQDIEIQYRSNSTEDANLLIMTTKMSADDSSCIFLTRDLRPWGATTWNDWLSPTWIQTNDEGADANDYAGVVIGERAQASVLVPHYFDFYAMTGAADGSVDPNAAEVAATFRFGDSGSAVPDNATGPGDVLFEDDVEINGNTWFDADAMLVDNILLNIGTGSDGSIEYDETTNDAMVVGVPTTDKRGIILCDKADIAADFTGVVLTAAQPRFNMVDADIDSSLSFGFWGDDTPGIVSDQHTLNINWTGDQGAYFFYDSGSGENQEVRVYGYDVGAVATRYGKIYIDTAGKFNFMAQETPIIFQEEIRVPQSDANVSNPPTLAELNVLFVTPGTVGAGWSTYIDDNGAGANFYYIVSDGDNWWIFTGVKAT